MPATDNPTESTETRPSFSKSPSGGPERGHRMVGTLHFSLRRDAAAADERYVGQLTGAEVPSTMDSREPRERSLARLLLEDPGQSAAALTVTLRRRGWAALTKQQVNATLYRLPDWFEKREKAPPVWSLTKKQAAGCAKTTERAGRVNGGGRDVVRSGPPLHAWQIEAIAKWRSGHRRGVIEAVTGAGKSLVGVEAAREAINDGRSTLLLVPGIELLRQWEAITDPT